MHKQIASAELEFSGLICAITAKVTSSQMRQAVPGLYRVIKPEHFIYAQEVCYFAREEKLVICRRAWLSTVDTIFLHELQPMKNINHPY